MLLICGADDAGRGPVIGPMVLAGVLASEDDIQKLQALGIKDSKLLTPKQRENLYDKIIKTVKSYKIVQFSPKEIDDALKSSTLNLNWLEALGFADIINALNPDKAIIDCPSTNTKAYSSYLKQHLKQDTMLKCEHKADFNYAIVGAASILAKVTRDREIEKIKEKIKIDFGSGYPSDPKTKEFLQKYHSKFPEIFRKTWATYKNITEKQQRNLSEF